MSLREDLIRELGLALATAATQPETRALVDLAIARDTYHGETAIRVTVELDLDYPNNRRWYVEGIFTTTQKAAFGGVDFAQQKDIPALMAAKVRAVLNGTAEEVQDLPRPQTFIVETYQDGNFWMVRIPGMDLTEDRDGLTQAETRTGVEIAAREYIALELNMPIENVAVTVNEVTS